ncbi:GNAT family N-acetyltransferase [Micromonospora zamorensis]|uniref:GNAT family N-acetyltransferase n=1 Tax=Micromonospora zamorensis TaxID=709883 RepID=UPI002E289B97|nr:GNAT family N-acetyltransferase [Micromonospora zamorensis]
MGETQIRPMRVEDVPAAERASAVTFFEGDRLSRRVSEPEVQPRSAAVGKQWIDRMSYLVETDPGGCWAAMDGDDMVGFAISQNREQVWYLATYGVLPQHQGRGLGRQLMDAVLAHADGRPGLFSSTVHPGATRRYRLAGFLLYPQMRMVGTVDRSTLPTVSGLSEGDENDIEWMDRLDVSRRGAGHGPDHEYMIRRMRLVVSRQSGRQGYVFIDEDLGQAKLLAAQDPQTASSLLWEALASSSGPTLINCITTANHWAIDVGLAARLDIGQEGYLALRGMTEPTPYLASGHFL